MRVHHRATALTLLVLLAWVRRLEACGQITGYVDEVSPQFINGWAGSPTSKPLWVHFFENASYLGSTPANGVQRADAAEFNGGNPWCGFSWAIPQLPPGSHEIVCYANESIYASTETPLDGARTARITVGDFSAPDPFGVVESATNSMLSGWAADHDSPAPVTVEIYVQFDGLGPARRVASTIADLFRPDVNFGGSSDRGFQVALPPIRGGVHSLYAVAKNQGAGNDRILEEFWTGTQWGIPATIAFPFEPAWNPDPTLASAPGCWTVLQAPHHFMCQSCPCVPFAPTWLYSITTDAINGWPIPAPESPYDGPPTRLRYDNAPGGGLLMKVDTYYDGTGEMWPWQFNFQAVQTAVPPIMLDAVDELVLEARVRIHHEGDWFYYDPDLTGPPSEFGPNPWIHLMAASVFAPIDRYQVWFVEPVLFYRENQVDPNYPPSIVGLIGGPPEVRNARLGLWDPRIAPSVNLPSEMALGEVRTIRMDLLDMVVDAFEDDPSGPVDLAKTYYSGSYVGTEQFGRNHVAFTVERLSVLPVYGRPVALAVEPAIVETGDSPVDVVLHGGRFTCVAQDCPSPSSTSVTANDTPISVEFIAPDRLGVTIPADLLALPGVIELHAVNPTPGGGASDPVYLRVERPCSADFAPPFGVLNIFDFLAFQTTFGNEDSAADLAPPFGTLNLFDFLAFQTAFGTGC